MTPEEPPDFRLVPSAAAVWLVTWQGHRLPVVVLLAAGPLLAALAFVLLLRRTTHGPWAAAVCGCTAAAAVITGLTVSAQTSGPVVELARQETAVVVTGTLLDDPHVAATRPGVVGRVPLVVVPLRVRTLTAHGHTYELSGRVVLLSSDRHWLGLLPSQSVRSEGRLRASEPGDDAVAVVSGRGPPVVLSPPSPVQRVAGRLREGLRSAVAPLPSAEAGLLPGLVVGDTSRLDQGLAVDFQAVGLTHLVAVSGTNCTVVVAAVLLLASRLGLGLRARPVVAAAALVGFAVLARPSPSVLRAVLMGGISLLALGTGTRRSAVPALCTAVLALLLAVPGMAGNAGFALSVLATAGLLVLAPPWTAALSGHMPTWLAGAIAVPAAAQAACGPVVAALSGQVGLLSVPANLLAAPAVAPATIAGVLAALTAPVCLPLAQALAWVGWLPTALLVRLARTGAGLPGAVLPWQSGGAGALLLALATAGGLLVLVFDRLRRTLLVGSTSAAVAVAGMAVLQPSWPPTGWFFVACDVGQGDGLVLRTGRGQAVVVDTGPDPAAMDACLRRLHVDVVPVVVLTHMHADHVDGLPGVLRGRRVGSILVGPLDEPRERYDAVLREAATAGVVVSQPGLGEVRIVGPVRWEVLAPARVYRGTDSDPNNSSLVLRVDDDGTRLLLTGDAEPEAQRDLLERGVDLRADVLEV